jgi:EAL domain-containing protein (putative c-di-GMP-specific phosphodiesterase class I)/CheY-like chemotaxis protein
VPASNSTAAANASGGARQGSAAASPGVVTRAEFPPPHYWRRWCADAPAAVPPAVEEAPAANEPLPQVLPQGDGTDAPYRVLIVEDDPSQALFAETVLAGTGMQARVVGISSEVMAAMDAFRPDLVLTDLHMPGLNGTEITTMIRATPGFAHTPIVFLTGDPDPETQFEVLQVGADDFLTKPVRPRHLIAAVESRVRRARALERQRSGEGRHPVTGLYTRTAMLQRLGAAIPEQPRGALYFVEIENTTALRDRFGYVALESALADTGRHIGQLAGEHLVSRLNDNTFVVYAADLDDRTQDTFARTLRDGVGRHQVSIDGQDLRLRALVGYASLQAGFGDASSALAAAEQALREARRLPVGIAAHHAPETAAVEADADRVVMIHDALMNNRFELAFQPIVAVAGGEEAQYQTLLRLRDQDGAIHTAAEILPSAEAAGVLHEIDRRVLELAIAILDQRVGENRPVRLFVSQSPRSLTRDGYAAALLETLAGTRIDGPSLVIDVRQDEALVHAVALQEFCSAMVPAGVQLCLSQYSAGPEADALLAQMPLGFMRLAARYSSQLGEGAVRDEMRAAIERAHRLGLQVIGQQVEDPQAAATLWMSGVDYIQGNLVQHAAGGLDFDFQHSVL